MPHMKRREFITLGGAAAAWPLAARAQSQPKMLRVAFVGVQPRGFPLYAAFLERMTELGLSGRPELCVRIHPNTEYRRLRERLSRTRGASHTLGLECYFLNPGRSNSRLVRQGDRE
jgi:hypothetical protein